MTTYPQYTLEEFANKLRAEPFNRDIYKDFSDQELADFWINKYPSSKKYLIQPRFTQRTRPANTGTVSEALWKDTVFDVKSKFIGLAPTISNAFNTLLDPERRLNHLNEDIKLMEQGLQHSQKISSMVGDTDASIFMENVRNNNLENLYNKRDIMEGVLTGKDPSRLAESVSGYSDKNRVGLNLYAQTQQVLYNAWKNYTLPTTKYFNEWVDETIDEWMKSDPRLRASKQWQQDVPMDSWDDLMQPDMVVRAFGDLASSFALMYTGGIVGNTAKILKAQKGSKFLTLRNSIGGVGATSVMFFLEGGEAEQDVLRYLTEEYQYDGGDGVMITGIPMEDALPIAGIVMPMVGGVNAMFERWQINKMARSLGITKGSSKSVIKAIVDKTMKRYKFRPGMGVQILSSFADVAVNAGQEGLVEGWQAGTQYIAATAVKNGYDISKPYGLNQLFSDAGLAVNEVGINNLLIGYASDIPEIRISSYTGAAGFGMTGAVQIPVSAGKYKLMKDGSDEQDLWVNKWIEDVKNGDNARITQEEYYVKLENLTKLQQKSALGVLKTSPMPGMQDQSTIYIPTSNRQQSKAIEDLILQEIGSNPKNLDMPKEYGTPLGYLDLILNQTSGASHVDDNADLVSDLKKKSSLNPVEQLILDHAPQGKKTSGGIEAAPERKLVDLLDLKENGNPVITVKTLDDLLIQAEREGDSARQEALKYLKETATNEIKERVKGRIKKQVVLKKGDETRDIVNNKIDEFINSGKIDEDKILKDYIDGKYEKDVGSALLKSKIANFGALNNEVLKKWISQEVPSDFEKGSTERSNLRLDNIEKANTINEKYIENKVNVVKKWLETDPITNLNQTGQQATGKGLYAALSQLFLNDTSIASLNNLLSRIRGNKDIDGMNATNIGKVLKLLKIPYTAKELGTPKGKTKYSKLLANRIFSDFTAPKINDGSLRVPEPVLDVERAIDRRAEVAIKTKITKELEKISKETGPLKEKAKVVKKAPKVVEDKIEKALVILTTENERQEALIKWIMGGQKYINVPTGFRLINDILVDNGFNDDVAKRILDNPAVKAGNIDFLRLIPPVKFVEGEFPLHGAVGVIKSGDDLVLGIELAENWNDIINEEQLQAIVGHEAGHVVFNRLSESQKSEFRKRQGTDKSTSEILHSQWAEKLGKPSTIAEEGEESFADWWSWYHNPSLGLKEGLRGDIPTSVQEFISDLKKGIEPEGVIKEAEIEASKITKEQTKALDAESELDKAWEEEVDDNIEEEATKTITKIDDDLNIC